MSHQKLFGNFSPTSDEAWEEALLKSLKGKPAETLIWQTQEGFHLHPYYRAKDYQNHHQLPGTAPFRRGIKTGNNSWEIQFDLEPADPQASNARMLEMLMLGATSIRFQAAFSDLDVILKQVSLAHIHICYQPEGKIAPALKAFQHHASRQGLDDNHLRFSVDADPLGDALLKGHWKNNCEEDLEDVVQAAGALTQTPLGKCINVRADHYHNAGASMAQELAFALSHGLEYLDRLTRSGLSIDDASARIRFTFAVGSGYFLEMAKLRIFRVLWAEVIAGYKPEHNCSHATYLHAVTSCRQQSGWDRPTNILRATTQAMSAVFGGCDSLTIQPFEIGKPANQPDYRFAERVALNLQLVLKEEAHFDKVADVAGGSWYIETATDKLGQTAWELFKANESAGGWLKMVLSGQLQEQVFASAQALKTKFENKEIVLVGVNKYPNPMEETVPPIHVPPAQKDPVIRPLVLFRLAASTENARSTSQL